MGDALAIAMLQTRGFTERDFARAHPGGILGRRLLLKIDDLMHTGDEMPVVRPESSLSEALVEMTRSGLGLTAVVSAEGKVEGIFTDGDLRRHMGGNLLSQTTDEVMTANPKTIRPHALAAEALNIMNSGRITSLFVVEDGPPVGIIHVHDCLRAGIV